MHRETTLLSNSELVKSICSITRAEALVPEAFQENPHVVATGYSLYLVAPENRAIQETTEEEKKRKAEKAHHEMIKWTQEKERLETVMQNPAYQLKVPEAVREKNALRLKEIEDKLKISKVMERMTIHD